MYTVQLILLIFVLFLSNNAHVINECTFDSTGITKKELTNVEKQEQTASLIYYLTELHHFLTLQ